MKIIRFSQKGLVGYWRFDEETGSTAKDSSPYGNDGTIYGATRVRGIIGKALEFDGVDDYVEVSDSPELRLVNGGTIVFWVKLATLSQPYNYPGVLHKWDGTNGWKITYSSLANRFAFERRNGGTANSISSNKNDWQANEWYCLAFVDDAGASKLYIYVNGELDNTGTRNIAIGEYTGSLRLSYGSYFNGTIDEVRIYNRALSPGEIKIIYAFTKYIKPHPIIMRRKL